MSKEQLLEDALRLYAGQHVLDRVLREGHQALECTTTRQAMTVMFIDLAGIVPAQPIEALTPELLRSWMSEHQERIGRCVKAHGGIIDSLIGDAVLAHWGMEPQPDDAACALRCAAQLCAEVAAFSKVQEARGMPAQRLLIGIHSGMVDLGNHGTPQRARYTVMGDAVNLASRMASRCREYDVPVLLSDATLALAGNALATSEVDTIRIKGKEHPVTLHTLGSAYVRPQRKTSNLPPPQVQKPSFWRRLLGSGPAS